MLYRHGDLSLGPQHSGKKMGVAAGAWATNAVESGELLVDSLAPASARDCLKGIK